MTSPLIIWKQELEYFFEKKKIFTNPPINLLVNFFFAGTILTTQKPPSFSEEI